MPRLARQLESRADRSRNLVRSNQLSSCRWQLHGGNLTFVHVEHQRSGHGLDVAGRARRLHLLRDGEGHSARRHFPLREERRAVQCRDHSARPPDPAPGVEYIGAIAFGIRCIGVAAGRTIDGASRSGVALRGGWHMGNPGGNRRAGRIRHVDLDHRFRWNGDRERREQHAGPRHPRGVCADDRIHGGSRGWPVCRCTERGLPFGVRNQAMANRTDRRPQLRHQVQERKRGIRSGTSDAAARSPVTLDGRDWRPAIRCGPRRPRAASTAGPSPARAGRSCTGSSAPGRGDGSGG
jgi:hypothetical protein